MPQLRLPKFLTDKDSVNRELAIIRFAEENNDILSKQFKIISQIGSTLKNIENMMFISLDFEKRKIALQMEQLQSQELDRLESKRETENSKNQSKSGGGFNVGSLASSVAKLGLKGMLGTFLFGFGMELLQWGKVLGIWRDKIAKSLVFVQTALDKFGDKIEAITGSKLLGGIVRSLLLIGSALGSIRVVFGVKAFAPIKAMFGLLGDLFKAAQDSKLVQNRKSLKMIFSFFELLIKLFASIGKLLGFVGEGGQLAKTIGVFGKLFSFLKVFAKVLGPIGILISLVDGIFGAMKGFEEGFKKGGLLNGIKEGFIGLVDGIFGGLIEMFTDLLSWILKKLGFEGLAEKLSGFNFKAFFGTIVDQIIYGFKVAFWLLGRIPSAIKSIMKKIIESAPPMLQKLLPDSLKAWANSASEDSSMPKPPPFRSASGDNSKKVAPPSRTDSTTTTAAPAERPPTAPTVDKNNTPDLGNPPVTSMTGNMTGRVTGSAASGSRKASGEADASQLLDLIASGESGKAGYDAVWNGTKVQPNKPVSTMTLGEVKQWQRDTLNEQASRGIPASRRSSAVGRYQFISGTLNAMMNKTGLGDNDKFSPENQDKLAMALLNNSPHGFNAFKAGKATADQFANYVASQWASVKNAAGGGQFDAAGFNKAHIGAEAIVSAASGNLKSATSGPGASSGAALTSAQNSVAAASSSNGGTIIPVNNSKTNVSTQTINQQANISAATPVEFASHVV